MSERPLPDDFAHWPDDPRELLGVAANVTPRELRRAYNRLIRIYKPEQAPEQFRRIREAYEYLLRIAEWFTPRADAPAAPAGEIPQPEQIWKAPTPTESAEEESDSAPPRRPEEELTELWQEAIAGRPSDAYERLTQMTRQYAGQTELYLRLYWLLVLFPELDARRVPADWLVQGLLATGMAGPLRELYREEVADEPAEALSERFDRLLAAPLSTHLLVDLAEWRILAAARLECWEKLGEDLPKWRLRFGVGEELSWLRLVFALADEAAWADDPAGADLLAACRGEINQQQHLSSSLSHAYDHFDLLMEATIGWWTTFPLHQVPVKFLTLVRSSWGRPFSESREELMEVLEEIAGAPQQWLGCLDGVHARGPALLSLFGELLDQLEAIREASWTAPRESEVQNGLVLSLLQRFNHTDYDGLRSRLLAFCLREDLAPEEIAEVASDFSGGWEELGAAWARSLRADWPLRYVCRACRLFWA